MRTKIITLHSTDIQIIDEDFISIDTSAGHLAMNYEQMLDLIAQFSEAVEKMDDIGADRNPCPICLN